MNSGEKEGLTRSCPKSSILGPYLRNAVIDGWLRLEHEEGIDVVVYADDVFVAVAGRSRNDVDTKDTNALLKATNRLRRHKLAL